MSVELIFLAALFLVVALVYGSVGFGGGTAYLAILTFSTVPIQHVPALVLICNIIVVSGSAWYYARAGLFKPALALPLLLFSVPAAFLCGTIVLESGTLRSVTGIVLVFAAVAMAVRLQGRPVTDVRDRSPARPWAFGPVIGGAMGGLAGLVGIGGGVFLAPVMHLLSWGSAKQIAAVCAVFILLNSVAGLAGRLTQMEPVALSAYLLLFAAVLIGGQIGSRAGVKWLSPRSVRQLTAVIVFIAAINLLLTG